MYASSQVIQAAKPDSFGSANCATAAMRARWGQRSVIVIAEGSRRRVSAIQAAAQIVADILAHLLAAGATPDTVEPSACLI